MSTTAKTIGWIIVIVIIVALIWWWVAASNSNNNTTSSSGTSSTTALQTGSYPASDTSNASVNADVSNIDAQMNQFSSDSAAINQGINDQPVPQQSM